MRKSSLLKSERQEIEDLIKAMGHQFVHVHEVYDGKTTIVSSDGKTERVVKKAYKVTMVRGTFTDLAMVLRSMPKFDAGKEGCDIIAKEDDYLLIEFYELRDRKQINIDEITDYGELSQILNDDYSRPYGDRVFNENVDFKTVACRVVGIANHPKKDKIYYYAYEQGHSSGYGEILNTLGDLVDSLFSDELDK